MLQIQKPLGETTELFRFGAVATHALALLLIVDATRSFKLYLSPTKPLLGWATFALHPLLMVAAFGFFAPMGAIVWRVYLDFLGLSHYRAKLIHMTCFTSAVCLGWIGIWDMYTVHERGAAAQIAKGWAVHFQSLHSWIGIVIMCAFTWQWLGGLIVFTNVAPVWCPSTFTRGIPVTQMARSKGTHALMGTFFFYGGILAVITGLLSLGDRGDNLAASDLAYKRLSIEVLLVGAAVGLTFAGPKPAPATTPSPYVLNVRKGDTQATLNIQAGGAYDLRVG